MKHKPCAGLSQMCGMGAFSEFSLRLHNWIPCLSGTSSSGGTDAGSSFQHAKKLSVGDSMALSFLLTSLSAVLCLCCRLLGRSRFSCAWAPRTWSQTAHRLKVHPSAPDSLRAPAPAASWAQARCSCMLPQQRVSEFSISSRAVGRDDKAANHEAAQQHDKLHWLAFAVGEFDVN